MIRKKSIQRSFLLFLLIISVSCLFRSEGEILVNNSNDIEETSSPEPIITHLVATPSLTVRPTETLFPSVTPTSASTVFSQPGKTPTTTPTLTPGEKDALVLDLFMTNASCELPCWWGFTPGETAWLQAQSSLQTIAEAIYSVGSPTLQSIDVYISSPGNEKSNPLRHYYEVQNGIIELIDVIIPIQISTYHLSNVLNTYGEPNSIFLLTGNQVWLGSLPFSVILFYPQYSLIFHYNGQASVVEDLVQICVNDTTVVRLAVWSPQLDLTYLKAAEMTLHLRPSPYELSLEEATGITTTNFYETFKNPENETCLETPAELWPNP